MKKLLSVFIIISMILSFTSCAIFNSSSINGEKLSSFVIVYDADGLDYNKRAAEYVANQIKERTGLELNVVTDDTAPTKHEIVVGETSREISKTLEADTEMLEFAILASGGSVALEADYFVIAAAAYFFIDTYVPKNNYKATVPTEISVHAPIVREAKNYIFLIGDGMGTNHTLLFDHVEDTTNYSDGESFFYGSMFPAKGFSKTNSLSGVTDSAAGGTALATGYKTENRYIGRLPDGTDVQSLTELAASLGMSTAVMSTDKDTGATPSTFCAHATDRDDDNEILNTQLALTQKYGTIIECNYNYYSAKYMNGTIEKKVTDTLDKLDDNEAGFFIMYEEAHIDKHAAKNDLESTLHAVIRFNQVIARYMEFAFYNPDTFVIITADHETGGLYADRTDGEPYFHTTDHTDVNVPIFAYGMGSELFDGKTMENTEIPKIIAKLMGVENFGDPNT